MRIAGLVLLAGTSGFVGGFAGAWALDRYQRWRTMRRLTKDFLGAIDDSESTGWRPKILGDQDSQAARDHISRPIR